MSVLPCGRSGCESIMCDRFSYAYGYLCDGCFDQLCQLPEDTDIRDFMRDNDPPKLDDHREHFSEEFPIR